jgi:hypoxanthine-guanine phosphoribosyltransferase
MAYFNQERKAEKAPKLKAIAKKYGVKITLGVNNYSTLVINVNKGSIDFLGNFNETLVRDRSVPATSHIQVNPYHYDKHFTGKALDFLKEIMQVANEGNYDKSDIQTDYFNVGWYVDVNIGKWNKPYELI